MKKIVIIGAGPGGLAAGLLLTSKGFDVHIYEKDERVGGRSQRLTLGDYHFDLGPTFLMYTEILENVFKKAGYDLFKSLELIQLDPLYKLRFEKHTFELSRYPSENYRIYEHYKKGLGYDYQKWLKAQERKLKKIRPILEKPFTSKWHYLRSDVLNAAFELRPFKSLYRHLSDFNRDETFIHTLSFQAKYLGMSSFEAPSIFSFLPYLEHRLGLYHVKGGLNQINEKMAELFQKNKGHLHLSSPVKNILIENQKALGIVLESGEEIRADEVVLNADFSYAMSILIDQKHLKKYHPTALNKKKYSVSTMMIYLGLNQTYDFSHHEIVFSKDYKSFLENLMNNQTSLDLSYYLHNPSKIDQTLAKPGHSALYILVPVPNLRGEEDFETEKMRIYESVIHDIETRYQVDIKKHIEVQKIITPQNWQDDYHVYLGAVFNFSHGLDQMLDKRPHNQFEEIKHLYLVGGGTHPGSGLPTIYQSALILDKLIT